MEGFELNVLLSLDFKLFKPKLIIIELEEEHDSFKYREDCKKLLENIKLCRNILNTVGYKLIYKDKINSIYKL